MSKLAKALTAAAGNAAGESLYVEDVFSTYLYTGNGGTEQAIVNNVNLLDEGGLVWIKERANAGTESHQLFDTERGSTLNLHTDSTGGNSNYGTAFKSFNDDGFSVQDSGYAVNDLNATYASWTFRKAEKFFDVVTYSGNNTLGRTVAHNLGSAPAFIIVKCTSNSTTKWTIYHSSLGATKFLEFDTGAAGTAVGFWNNTEPTDSVFTLGNDGAVNATGREYVAYLFASDAGGFGDDGSESIIKCGSYVGNGTYTQFQDLGFEPQWILFKNASAADDWWVYDSMRGLVVGGPDNRLAPNLSSAEAVTGSSAMTIAATGFTPNAYSTSGQTYIYIAIRRPMKTPESGTEVFNPVAYTGTSAPRMLYFNNPVDTAISDWRSGSQQENMNHVAHRQLSTYFTINDTSPAADNEYYKLDNSQGVYKPNTVYNRSGNYYVTWGLTRAKGFYDVVIGGGKSLSSEVLSHNLGVTPELVLIRGTEQYGNAVVSVNLSQWIGWAGDYNYFSNSGFISAWDSTTITTQQYVSNTTSPQSIMLFASLAGVSKVGTYSGNNSTKTIDCGFSNGARFVMIKRTDAGSNQGLTTSNWYIWDSARGISSGNDPYLTNALSSTFAENNSTDSIDPNSSGFIVNQNSNTDVNKSGASYLFLAIA